MLTNLTYSNMITIINNALMELTFSEIVEYIYLHNICIF